MSLFVKNDSRRLSHFLQTHIFWKFDHISRTYNQINYRKTWFGKVIIILIMMTQVLFLDIFFEKDPHLNAVKVYLARAHGMQWSKYLALWPCLKCLLLVCYKRLKWSLYFCWCMQQLQYYPVSTIHVVWFYFCRKLSSRKRQLATQGNLCGIYLPYNSIHLQFLSLDLYLSSIKNFIHHCNSFAASSEI